MSRSDLIPLAEEERADQLALLRELIDTRARNRAKGLA